MFRNILEYFNRLLCFVKKARRLTINKNPLKINCGSGLAVTQGWYNVDASLNALFAGSPTFMLKRLFRLSRANEYFSESDYLRILKTCKYIHHNIQYGIPFTDNSVDVVYSSHMLEHLFSEDAKTFMKEAFRVLKRGGVARICVPDLDYALEMIHEGKIELSFEMFFFQVKSHNYLARHKYMYNFDMLKKLFEETGFKDVTRCEYKKSQKIPDVNLLDVKPDETLYIEGIKP